jgi:putative aldouronate transport system permease protein
LTLLGIPAATSPRRPYSAQRTRIRQSRGDRLFMACVYVFLAVFCLLILYPLWYVLICSFSSANDVLAGTVWFLPEHFTFFAYNAIFHYPAIWQSYINSVIYTLSTAALTIVLTMLMAYPLAQRRLPGRRIILWLLLVAFLFNGGLVPLYLVVKDIGILNTPLAVILPTALNIYWVIIARTFIRNTIPEELLEAAQMDGAGHARTFWEIVVPLSKPIIAVVGLVAAVAQWNSYFYALIFLNSPSLYPLQLVLREILVLNQISPGSFTLNPQQLQLFQDIETLTKYALIVVSLVPILVFYPVAQRYFVKGLLIGSLKD